MLKFLSEVSDDLNKILGGPPSTGRDIMPTNQKVKRSDLIKNLLISKGHGLTVSEIIRELSIPNDHKKFVSSGLIGWLKAGKVSKVRAICTVTNRTVDQYSWVWAGRQQPSQAAPGKASRAPRAPKAARPPKAAKAPGAAKAGPAQPPPPPPSAFTAEELRKIDAKRRAAANNAAARDAFLKDQAAMDLTNRAYLEFEKITGCRQRGSEEARAAFKTAALRLHPDRGGDAEVFGRLSNAWKTIKTAQGI